MDLAVVTPALYVWEFEIKLSMSDWRRDGLKDKWRTVHALAPVEKKRRFVSRFYYAVPEKLIEKGIPDFVPEEFGIIAIYQNEGGHIYSREIRKSKIKRGEKIKPEKLIKFLKKSYFQYWRARIHG